MPDYSTIFPKVCVVPVLGQRARPTFTLLSLSGTRVQQ